MAQLILPEDLATGDLTTVLQTNSAELPWLIKVLNGCVIHDFNITVHEADIVGITFKRHTGRRLGPDPRKALKRAGMLA